MCIFENGNNYIHIEQERNIQTKLQSIVEIFFEKKNNSWEFQPK